jgi:hypothetical protein
MRHDVLCERLLSTYDAAGCKCASRAYWDNPLPEPDWTPIWAIQKTPGQEGG